MGALVSLPELIGYIRDFLGPRDILVFERVDQANLAKLIRETASVRVWSDGEPSSAMELKDVMPSIRTSAKKMVACADFFDDVSMADRKIPDGFRYLGQSLCSHRKGIWKIYLSRGVLTVGYAPRDFITVTLSDDQATALAQAKSLFRLIGAKSPPRNRGVYLYAAPEEAIGSQLFQFLTSALGQVQPLRLGRQSLLRGMVLPVDLRLPIWILLSSAVIYGAIEVSRLLQIRSGESTQAFQAEQPERADFSKTPMGAVISHINKLIESEGLSIRPGSKLEKVAVRLEDKLQYEIEITFSSEKRAIEFTGEPKGFTEAWTVNFDTLGIRNFTVTDPTLKHTNAFEGLPVLMLQAAQRRGLQVVVKPSVMSETVAFEIRSQSLTNVIEWMADFSRHGDPLFWSSIVMSGESNLGSITIQGELLRGKDLEP